MRSSLKSTRSPDSSAGAFESERRELARRFSAGVDVTLYWHPTLDEVIVCVWDERNGAYFEIRPQRDLALDVYHHPYAYAELADVRLPTARNFPGEEISPDIHYRDPWQEQRYSGD